MSRTLIILAVSQARAEAAFRSMLEAGHRELLAIASEALCRAGAQNPPPAYRENVRIWRVREAVTHDGPVVIATDVTDNVVMLQDGEWKPFRLPTGATS